MGNLVVVIGGNGFIGYSVITELVKRGIFVKCVDINRPEDNFSYKEVEYCIGDIWDKGFLTRTLKDANCVMDFLSTSMPNTNDISLSNEINNTLRYHDYILSSMVDSGINKYIFPSSGGAIYGNKTTGFAFETDILKPTTPYGVGKKMAEDIIHYYCDKCGMAACILRIGNVYGSPRLRSKAQGVIDVFTQNILRDEKITIWGNAKSAIRDYIYLEDVARAIVDVSQVMFDDYRVYNVGSGIGTSLSQIIELIGRHIGKDMVCQYMESMASGINTIVLSNEKIKNEIDWSPKISLEDGIIRTIKIKKKLLNLE